jgi:hypothetical protein
MKKNGNFRIISGVAYPHLIRGKNKTTRVEANLADREAYYYDEAIRLSENDIASFKQLKGMPLCVEHNQKVDVGEITHSWTDEEGMLRFMARIDLDKPAGKVADAALARGELSGVSVGYVPHIDRDNMEVYSKHFQEVSLCREGFFPGAQVSVTASKKTAAPSYNSKAIPTVYYKITASATENMESTPPVENTPAPETTAPTQSAPETKTPEIIPPMEQTKDVSELARQTDEMLRKNEELQEQLKKAAEEQARKDARLKQLEEAEAKRQAAYEAEKAKELEKILEINRAQYKEVYGEEAELPVDYQQAAGNAFKYEQMAPQMQAISASALAYEKKKQENEKLQEELKIMASKMRKLEETNTLAMSHVSANHRRIFKTPVAASASDEEEKKTGEKQDAEQVPVNASGGNMGMLFVPAPSQMEQEIIQRDYGSFNSGQSTSSSYYGVYASGARGSTKTMAPAPEHPHLSMVKNSMRFNCPQLFTHMTTFDSGAQSAYGMHHTLDVNGKPVNSN